LKTLQISQDYSHSCLRRPKAHNQSAEQGTQWPFAQAVREKLNQILKKYGLRKTRLFFYGPYALAVFLGQQLTSVGEIQLFEYQDPGYVPSCLLRT